MEVFADGVLFRWAISGFLCIGCDWKPSRALPKITEQICQVTRRTIRNLIEQQEEQDLELRAMKLAVEEFQCIYDCDRESDQSPEGDG